jgi:hypothetical protein
VVTLLLAGCGHVTLVVPPPDLSHARRVEAYEQLRPASREVEKIVTWTNQELYEATEWMTLGNGQRVQHPVDLLPVVLPTSDTARQILSYRERQVRWTVWGGLSAGSMLTGASLIISSLFLPRATAPTVVWTGLVMAVVGTLSSVSLGALFVGNTASDRERCFTSYEADLREYLQVDAPDPVEAAPENTPPEAAPAEDAADPTRAVDAIQTNPELPAVAPALRTPLRPVPQPN